MVHSNLIPPLGLTPDLPITGLSIKFRFQRVENSTEHGAAGNHCILYIVTQTEPPPFISGSPGGQPAAEPLTDVSTVHTVYLNSQFSFCHPIKPSTIEATLGPIESKPGSFSSDQGVGGPSKLGWPWRFCDRQSVGRELNRWLGAT